MQSETHKLQQKLVDHRSINLKCTGIPYTNEIDKGRTICGSLVLNEMQIGSTAALLWYGRVALSDFAMVTNPWQP